MKTAYAPDTFAAHVDSIRDMALASLPAAALLAAIVAAAAVASAVTKSRF